MSEPKKPATSKFQPLPTSKKVFDVVRPGKSPALPTSRPVITGHKPSVADDQFVPAKSSRLAADPAERHELLDSSAHFKDLTTAQLVPEDTSSQNIPAAEDAPVKKMPRVISSAVLAREVDVAAEPMTDKDELADKSLDSSDGAAEASSAVQKEKGLEELAIDPMGQETQPIAGQDHEHELVESPKERPKDDGSADKLLQPFTDQELADHMSRDDVLANTNAPLFDHQHMVVSHHQQRMRVWQFLLIFLFVIVVAVVAFNFLLDAEAVTPDISIPHTDFIR